MRKASPGQLLPLAIYGCSVVAYSLYRHHQEKDPKQVEKQAIAAGDEARQIQPTVSYINVKARSLEASKQFYLRVGFVLVSQHGDSEVLLRVPGEAGKVQPYLLLEHDDSLTEDEAGNASMAGYARMCILVQDCHAEIARLDGFGYKPVAPAVTDRPGTKNVATEDQKHPFVTICAFFDPDGTMVEMVSFVEPPPIPMSFPAWVHVNINCTSYEASWKAYQQLGLVMGIDYGRVDNTLYKALAIPNPGLAKSVSLIQFPTNRFFSVDLIEWENPKTVLAKTPSPMQMAITVKDVAATLDDLVFHTKEAPLWNLKSKPAVVTLPDPLQRAVKCTVQDSDGTLVDLVSFPRTLLTKEQHLPPPHQDDEDGTIKVVLVTGCDSGFGRSLTLHLAGLGFKVVAACYTQTGADFLSQIATTVVADLLTSQGVQAVLETVKTSTKPPNAQLWAVVNNAGMHFPGHVEWTAPSSYRTVMDLNFFAPLTFLHECTPLLRHSKGRMVNVTSVCGLVSAPSNSTYSASKFALEALSDALRVENASFGVKVVVIQPTTMRTPLASSWYSTWMDLYKKAPEEKKKWHSQAWADKTYETGSATLQAAAEDAHLAVCQMLDGVMLKDPPARLRAGVGAEMYWHFRCMKDEERDAVFACGPTEEEKTGSRV